MQFDFRRVCLCNGMFSSYPVSYSRVGKATNRGKLSLDSNLICRRRCLMVINLHATDLDLHCDAI